MSKNDVIKYIVDNNLSISGRQIIINVMVAMILGLCIYGVYRITYKGTGYSAGFGQSLTLMSIIVAVIMTTIQSNLALSLGLVGSLSIIRFRTAVKDVRDAVFVLWAISIGISCGASVFLPGIVGSVAVAVLMVAFSFRIYEKTLYLLIIEAKSENVAVILEKIIKESTKSYMVKSNVVSSDKYEIIYELNVRKGMASELIGKVSKESEVLSCRLISYDGESIE